MSETKSLTIAELRRASKLPAKQAGGSVVSQFFELNRDTIAAVLPRHMTPERMLKIALGALRTTPKLMECTTESLFGAVVLASQLGLEPNSPLGHCYLIPYYNGKKKTTEVQFIPGYKGLLALARRSGEIISIAAHAVRENDLFEFEYGLNETLRHVPARSNAGDIIAFYAVAKLKGGGYQFEVMWRDQVDVIRNNSQGYKSAQKFGSDSPWTTHYEEMGRKTVIRRLVKYCPMSIELSTAVALDEAADLDTGQGLDNVLSGEFTVDAPESQTAADPAQSGNGNAELPAADLGDFGIAVREAEDAAGLDGLAKEAEGMKEPAARKAALDLVAARRKQLAG